MPGLLGTLEAALLTYVPPGSDPHKVVMIQQLLARLLVISSVKRAVERKKGVTRLRDQGVFCLRFRAP